jgi:membrane protease YdiL (CAAX protease family)
MTTASPVGVAAVLLTFLPIWPGVWLAVRVLHRRPLRTVLGAEGRLAWGDFGRGLAAVLIASAVTELPMLVLDPTLERSSVGLGAWLLLFAPLTALILLQTSAEELAFRGYLVQSLAARFRTPLIWGVLPGLLFTVAHWNGNAPTLMNAAILFTIATVAAVTTILVYRTGNLGAAMGVHLGANVFSILVVSHMDWLGGVALFTGKPVDAGGWTIGEAVGIGASGAVMMGLILWLLLAARSPLRVGPPTAGQAPR